jgi:hypothetical protein
MAINHGRRDFPVGRHLIWCVFIIGMFSTSGVAQIQPGSTGGTIGKRDKSISGSEDAAPPNESLSPKSRQTTARPNRQDTSKAALAGGWNWNASCPNGNFKGEFEIRSTSASAFSGHFLSDVPGAISNGQLDGKQVTFTRHYSNLLGTFLQSWTGSLTQSRIAGSLVDQPSGIRCTWEAAKK